MISLTKGWFTPFIGLLGLSVEVPVVVHSNRKRHMNIIQMVERLLCGSLEEFITFRSEKATLIDSEWNIMGLNRLNDPSERTISYRI